MKKDPAVSSVLLRLPALGDAFSFQSYAIGSVDCTIASPIARAPHVVAFYPGRGSSNRHGCARNYKAVVTLERYGKRLASVARREGR